MSQLLLMYGHSFSGKSTIATFLSNEFGYKIISLDQINAERGLNGGDGIPVEEWQKSHNIALQNLEKYLMSGQKVIIDDTNCFRFLRDNYRSVAKKFNISDKIIWIKVDLEVIYTRIKKNQENQGRHGISLDVFHDHLANFENPTTDEEYLVYDYSVDIKDWIKNLSDIT